MRVWAAGLAVVLLAAPALADVKAGVDAWARQDYKAAIAQWRGPAAAGDADAQYNLGQAYRRGLGVPHDEKAAIEWYRKAADRGHAQAQASLALILFQSDRRKEAMPWLEKASAQGEARAQYVLGTALFNGDGTAKDWPRAYALMRRASLGGLQPATDSLKQMEGFMTPADRQKGDAVLRTLAARAAPATASPTRPAAPAVAEASPAEKAAAAGTRAAVPAATSTDKARAAVEAKTKPADAATRTAARPAEKAKVDATEPASGWKVQLGAFARMEAARAHWKTLSARPALAALKPVYAERGGMVRLQAGPLANRAAAQRACAAATAAGSACFALQP